MVTDEELLAACLSAGEPGTESHRRACRLYRKSVLEWQAAHEEWREEYANRTGLGLAIALITEAADSAGWFIKCGTPGGYSLHIRHKTPVCPECREAHREYDRNRVRLRLWTGTWPLPVAAVEPEAA